MDSLVIYSLAIILPTRILLRSEQKKKRKIKYNNVLKLCFNKINLII